MLIATAMPDSTQIIAYGPTAVLLFLILTFLWKVAPTWKEVKLRELDIRAAESGTNEKVATALSSLATVLQAIGVDQRRATEDIRLMQRSNAEASDNLASSIQALGARLDAIEGLQYQEVLSVTHDLAGRMERLETNAGPESTKANP